MASIEIKGVKNEDLNHLLVSNNGFFYQVLSNGNLIIRSSLAKFSDYELTTLKKK